MAKIWQLKSEILEEVSNNLSKYPKLLRQLLFNRGLTNTEQIEEFLNPQYTNLHSPFLFKDMEKAVERVWKAINDGHKICIYGDYDADAVTANAVLQQTFKYLGVEVLSYIPDRFSEGYGVNMDALLKIKDQGSRIIITVDCGTNSIDAAEFCRQNNIDLIITDHHEIIGEHPKAYALINPKNPQDNYPYHEITGVGVAFKLACAILNKLKVKSEKLKVVDGWEKWLLDLVAIGTVADCHSLVGENRILVNYGLKVLAKTRWVGLKAIINCSNLDFNSKPADTYTLGFVIAPRLNAAGRLEHANIALELLMETNPLVAAEKAAELEKINLRRQQLTQSVLSEAKEKVIQIQSRKVLVLVGEGWPKGIMGLVAGRLAEEYYKPVIVLEQTENLCTGSARTAGEFDLIEALKFSSEHLVKFGGHKQAAGLTLDIGRFDLFYKKLLDFAEASITEENSQRILHLEAELNHENLKLETFNLITQFEPFGVGNPKPKFLIKDLKIISLRLVGSLQQHLQLQLSSTNKNISGIMFNCGDFAKTLKIGDTVEVAAELIKDEWNGREQLKLRIIDIKRN